MQCTKRIVLCLEAVSSREEACSGCLFISTECIDHDITHLKYAVLWNAFTSQVFVTVLRRRKQVIRQSIGHDSIHFFRHRSIETSQSRLHMSHRNMAL